MGQKWFVGKKARIVALCCHNRNCLWISQPTQQTLTRKIIITHEICLGLGWQKRDNHCGSIENELTLCNRNYQRTTTVRSMKWEKEGGTKTKIREYCSWLNLIKKRLFTQRERLFAVQPSSNVTFTVVAARRFAVITYIRCNQIDSGTESDLNSFREINIYIGVHLERVTHLTVSM